MSRNTAIRLYVDTPLAVGGEISFNEEQSRYLGAVMRLAPGDAVLLFDGMNGEFSAESSASAKKRGLRPLLPVPVRLRRRLTCGCCLHRSKRIAPISS